MIVDEGPLDVALEEVRPDLEHREAEALGVQVRRPSLLLLPRPGPGLGLVKVYHVVRFLDDSSHPMQDALLASWKFVLASAGEIDKVGLLITEKSRQERTSHGTRRPRPSAPGSPLQRSKPLAEQDRALEPRQGVPHAPEERLAAHDAVHAQPDGHPQRMGRVQQGRDDAVAS